MNYTIKLTLVAGTAALLLAGCGGGSDKTQASPASYGGGGQQPAGREFPGGSGEIVEVDGSTAQVQGQDDQVAVSWTDSTTFTQQVTASSSDVKVGSCVMVQPTGAGSGSDSGTVAAGTVRIVAATDGECSMGAGMGGGRPGGDGGAPQGGDMPDGERPSGAPEGGPDGGRGGFGAFGKVTEIGDDGFVVESVQPGSDDATSITVSLSATTTYSTTAEAAASDVKVGVCVVSQGEADDTGAIAATTIAISQKVDGSCNTFGGMRGQGSGSGQGGNGA